MTGLRRCGKPYASRDEAERSKKGRTGRYLAVPCGGGHWHLQKLVLKPIPSGTFLGAGARKDTGPDAKVRAAVYARDGFACVCCGVSIAGRPHSVGHRKRRSQGGTHDMTNLLTFLGLGRDAGDPDDHHARIDSLKNPHDAAKGYTCKSYEDPASIAVMYFGQDGGFTAWLEADGGLTQDEPVTA